MWSVSEGLGGTCRERDQDVGLCLMSMLILADDPGMQRRLSSALNAAGFSDVLAARSIAETIRRLELDGAGEAAAHIDLFLCFTGTSLPAVQLSRRLKA